MLNIFKKNQQGKKETFKISGMHCVSCGLNIDGELEDTEGIYQATTSYAKGETVVEFDEKIITPNQIEKIITKAGYQVE